MECHIPSSLFNEPRTEATGLSRTFLTPISLSPIHASKLTSVDWVLVISICLSFLGLSPSTTKAFGPVSSLIVRFSSQLATLFVALIASKPRPFWLLLAVAPLPDLLLSSFALSWQHQTCACCKFVDASAILSVCNWDSAVRWYKMGHNLDHHFKAQLYHRISLDCQVYWKENQREETHSVLCFNSFPGLLGFYLEMVNVSQWLADYSDARGR